MAMRKALAVSFVVSLFCFSSFCILAVSSQAAPQDPQDQQDQGYYQTDQGEYVPYSPEQLDNLLAPIALYPDPLLAQVLPATTFTDQIDDAARYVREYGQDGVDEQNWDVSVRAVAHYPEVLEMMDEKLDWTTAVGQAYVNQSTDVMESVQRLRRLAYDQGNLVTTPQWEIVSTGGFIQIWPATPEYIYVPTYDPAIIYYRRCYYDGGFRFGFTFGRSLFIGVWLNRDTDWRDRRIYYTGWRGDEGWQRRSRPFVERRDVHVTNVYVNNTVNSTNITVNKTVINRTVNVQNINNYTSVHKNVNFNNVARNRPAPMPGRPQINNRAINQNINTNDPRLNQFRGHQNAPAPGRPQENTRVPEQEQTRPAVQQRPETQRPLPGRPQEQQPPQTAQPPRQFPPEQSNRQPRPETQPRPQFQPPPREARPTPSQENGPHAFGRSETNFNPRAAQQRGAQSRQQMSRPAPRPAAPRPAPPQRQSKPAPSRPHHPGGEL
jgi:uncharacterized protein DUF3300